MRLESDETWLLFRCDQNIDRSSDLGTLNGMSVSRKPLVRSLASSRALPVVLARRATSTASFDSHSCELSYCSQIGH